MGEELKTNTILDSAPDNLTAEYMEILLWRERYFKQICHVLTVYEQKYLENVLRNHPVGIGDIEYTVREALKFYRENPNE